MVSSVLPQVTWFSEFPFETGLLKVPVHMTHSLDCKAVGPVFIFLLWALDEILGTKFVFPFFCYVSNILLFVVSA